MEEKTLLMRAKQGDRKAQGKLIEQHQNKVFRLAMQLSGNAADAEDIAQEALVKALQGLSRFRGEAAFSTWLYRITYNTAMGFIGHRKRTADAPDALEYAAPTADNPAELHELAAAISRAVDALSERQRQCFRLKHFEDLKIKEIAAITGIESGSVKQHLFRAVQQLRKTLKPFAPGRL